jgi:hypothetical protein
LTVAGGNGFAQHPCVTVAGGYGFARHPCESVAGGYGPDVLSAQLAERPTMEFRYPDLPVNALASRLAGQQDYSGGFALAMSCWK